MVFVLELFTLAFGLPMLVIFAIWRERRTWSGIDTMWLGLAAIGFVTGIAAANRLEAARQLQHAESPMLAAYDRFRAEASFIAGSAACQCTRYSSDQVQKEYEQACAFANNLHRKLATGPPDLRQGLKRRFLKALMHASESIVRRELPEIQPVPMTDTDEALELYRQLGLGDRHDPADQALKLRFGHLDQAAIEYVEARAVFQHIVDDAPLPGRVRAFMVCAGLFFSFALDFWILAQHTKTLSPGILRTVFPRNAL